MNSLPAPFQRWLTLLMPPFAILICCFVMVPRQNKLRQVNQDIRKAQTGVQDYLTRLKDISDLPKDPAIASMPMTKQEQSDFLRDLTSQCYQSGNKMLSITSLAAPPPAPAQPGNAPAKPAAQKTAGALPPDATEIKSTITFIGDFDSLRSFLTRLQQSRRLISLADCRVEAAPGGFPSLQTTLTITRYVDTAPQQPAATGGDGVKTASAG